MPARQTRRSDQEWLQLITECRQSGLSDKAWTELHDIPSSSFYNAVSRLRKNACTIPEPTGTTPMLDLTSNKQDVVQIDILPDDTAFDFRRKRNMVKAAVSLRMKIQRSRSVFLTVMI